MQICGRGGAVSMDTLSVQMLEGADVGAYGWTKEVKTLLQM